MVRLMKNPRETNSGPLSGYRIIEFCHFIAGPSAVALLADQGADVVKVEPITGDLMRTVAPFRNGLGASFITWNRNKSSVSIDMTTSEGQQVAHRLVGDADVAVHNYRPGVVERIGIDEATLRKIKPDLIYVVINGYGEDGPYAHRPGFDPMIQALSGLGRSQARLEDNPRFMVRSSIADKLSGLVSAQAVTAALCERERTGKGAKVEVAMLDLAIAFGWGDIMSRETFVGHIPPSDTLLAGDYLQDTLDGDISVMPNNNKQLEALARLVGHEEWIDDPRVNTPTARTQNLAVYCAMMKNVFRSKTTAEWCELLEEAGVPYAPVLSPPEVVADQHVKFAKLVVESDHPVAGRIRECRAAARFNGRELPIYRHAPAIGEHTVEILQDAGFSQDEIESLAANNVIRTLAACEGVS